MNVFSDPVQFNNMTPKLLLFLLLFVRIRSELDTFRAKTIRIYRFKGICPAHKDAPINYSSIQINNVNRTFHVSMRVYIRKDIDHGLKLRLHLSRCSSRDSLDSCETYNTIKINHFCNLLNAERKPWTEFVNLMSPPLNCPLRKGVYVVQNGTFDGNAFSHFPVVDWYWKIMVNLLDETTGDILACSTLEGQIAPI